jgi:hypothetical protein
VSVSPMSSKKRTGPERDDSKVSGKVACARARIPARFVEKWGDANLAKMTRQLVNLRTREWGVGERCGGAEVRRCGGAEVWRCGGGEVRR